MGENIGATARAMANFSATDLRVVSPRDGWPNAAAQATAKHAAYIVDSAMCTDSLDDALSDCSLVYAVTARMREVSLPTLTIAEAAKEAAAHNKSGQKTAFMFGRERDGLTNDEVSRAHAIATIPVSPDYPSLNLAQAAALCAYECFMAKDDATLPKTPEFAPAPHEELEGFLRYLEKTLDENGFFRVEEKREATQLKLRAYVRRSRPTSHDVGMLYGIVKSLIKGNESVR